MIRHPFYLLLCLFATGYLALADARGWSFFQSAARNFARVTGSRGSYGSFNHK